MIGIRKFKNFKNLVVFNKLLVVTRMYLSIMHNFTNGLKYWLLYYTYIRAHIHDRNTHANLLTNAWTIVLVPNLGYSITFKPRFKQYVFQKIKIEPKLLNPLIIVCRWHYNIRNITSSFTK